MAPNPWIPEAGASGGVDSESSAGTADAEVASPQVMAAVDGEGADAQFVVADVSRDDAWVTMAAADAAPLPEWR